MDPTAYRLSLAALVPGAQILFIAFGGLVLVPILTGLDPSVALFTAGLGTLLFQWITRGAIPVFLGSSFAFIPAITYGREEFGLPATLSGLAAAGLFYVLLSRLIAWRGRSIVTRLLPPVVTGPVIMVIGLSLAPIAVRMASEPQELYGQTAALSVAGLSMMTTIIITLRASGLLRLMPILFGVGVGYLIALPLGMVDLSALRDAPWFALPPFVAPKIHFPAIAAILPVAIVPAIEHVGDVLAISQVTGKPYLQEPGLSRTLLGDGLATSLAAALGGPPNTTYSEVTGAVALTRAFNPAVMTWAALLSVLLAFSGKVGGFLRTIPPPVMGGVLVVLFGAIVVLGINSLVQAGEDLSTPRHLVIVGSILVLGVGGLSLRAGQFTLEGLGLASIIGLVLNALLPHPRTTHPGG